MATVLFLILPTRDLNFFWPHSYPQVFCSFFNVISKELHQVLTSQRKDVQKLLLMFIQAALFFFALFASTLINVNAIFKHVVGNCHLELQNAAAGSVTEKSSGSDGEWKNAVWKLGQRQVAGVEDKRKLCRIWDVIFNLVIITVLNTVLLKKG